MNLGDKVKYIDQDGNEILAIVQAKMNDDSVVVSLPGGVTVAVPSDDVGTGKTVDPTITID